MFSGIRTTLYKAKLAPMLDKLLWHASVKGLFKIDRELSHRLIRAALNARPDIFDGHYGRRPHPVSAAGFVLAHGLERESDADTHFALSGALLSVLTDVRDNARLYEFGGLDWSLLELADEVFALHSSLDGFDKDRPLPPPPGGHVALPQKTSSETQRTSGEGGPAGAGTLRQAADRSEQMKRLAAELAALQTKISK